MLGRFANVVYWSASTVAALIALFGLVAVVNNGGAKDSVSVAVALWIVALLAWLFGRGFRYILVGENARKDRQASHSVSQRDLRSSTDPLRRFHEEYLRHRTSRPW